MSSRLQERVRVVTDTGGSTSSASALALATDGTLVAGHDLRVDLAQAATVEPECGGVGEMVTEHWCHLADRADRQALVGLALSRFNVLQYISDDEWARAPREEVDLFRRDEGLVAAHGW
jgi:hypothetical protein